jgi:hypothetical protein
MLQSFGISCTCSLGMCVRWGQGVVRCLKFALLQAVAGLLSVSLVLHVPYIFAGCRALHEAHAWSSGCMPQAGFVAHHCFNVFWILLLLQ